MVKESLSKRASEIRKAAIKSRRSMKSKFSGPVVMTTNEKHWRDARELEVNPKKYGSPDFGKRGGTKKRKSNKKRKTSRRK
jgi:hypothetical protein